MSGETRAEKVGEVYPGLSFPVAEIGEYNYFDAGHELRLFFRSPRRAEIEAVKRERAEFALLVEGSVIFFLYRFGFSDGVPWSDAPYTLHLVPEERRQVPTGSGRALLTVVLADAQSGVVRAIRAVTLSEEFTATLHETIRDQAASRWSQAEYDHDLAVAYAEYPDTESMLEKAIARTRGGK